MMTWVKLRAKRNQLLEQTDKYMLSDFPIDTKERSRFRDYRQYLRDLPKLFNDETIHLAKVKNFAEYIEFRKSGEY